MTWYFDPSGTSFDLYSPDGSQAVSDATYSGSWGGAAPTEAYEEAVSYTSNQYNLGNITTETALSWIGQLVADDIQEGTP